MAALDQDSSEARTIPAISRERLAAFLHSLRWVQDMDSGVLGQGTGTTDAEPWDTAAPTSTGLSSWGVAGLGAEPAATGDPLSQNWEQWEPSATLLYAELESAFRVWYLHAWEDSGEAEPWSSQILQYYSGVAQEPVQVGCPEPYALSWGALEC